jgi:hypothetical protein
VLTNIELNTEANIQSGVKAAVATSYASQPVISNETTVGVLSNLLAGIAASPAPKFEDVVPAQPVNAAEVSQSVWSSGLTPHSPAVNVGSSEWTGSTIAKSIVEPGAYAANAAARAAFSLSPGLLRPGNLGAGSVMSRGAAMSTGVATTTAATTTAATTAPVSLTSLSPAFSQISPYLSAAVAAYRVNDAVASKLSYEFVERDSETVPGVSSVSKNRAMNLDLHNGSNGNRNQQASPSAARAGAHNESDLNATAPLVPGLDVSA